MFKRLSLSLLLVATGIVTGLVLSGRVSERDEVVALPTETQVAPVAARQTPPAAALSAGPDFTGVAAQTVKAVTNISAVQVVRRPQSPFANDPFFQQFFADSTKAPPLSVQRLTLDGDQDVARYSVLIIRGSSTKTDFDGHLTLEADLVPVRSSDVVAPPISLSVAGDGAEASLPLRLKFKYYQRVEGTLRIPPGYVVRTLTARVYEAGAAAPRATRTLALP